MAKHASTETLIDVFRDRLILLIHGEDGGIHGFVARRRPDLTDDDRFAGPKYLNTRETDLFTKGNQLFGLARSLPALRAGATPVIVEGPLDALAVTFASDGRYVGVATLGTGGLTVAHAHQLRALAAPTGSSPPQASTHSTPTYPTDRTRPTALRRRCRSAPHRPGGRLTAAGRPTSGTRNASSTTPLDCAKPS